MTVFDPEKGVSMGFSHWMPTPKINNYSLQFLSEVKDSCAEFSRRATELANTLNQDPIQVWPLTQY